MWFPVPFLFEHPVGRAAPLPVASPGQNIPDGTPVPVPSPG